MDFGTFLLMQSPSARTSQEIYSRGVEVAQAAEALGFRNVWLAEHHFSTYGYLVTPRPARDVHRGEDDPAAGGHGRHRRAAPPSTGGRRGDCHARPAERRAPRRRPRPRLPALR